MRTSRKWVAALGIAAATPGLSHAGPFNFFKKADPPAATAAEKATNQALADAVADQLRAARLRGTGVEIEVTGGVCLLRGEVADARSREVAAWAAGQVAGVTEVANEMTVAATPVSPAVVRPAPAVEAAPTFEPVLPAAAEFAAPATVTPVGAEAPLTNQQVAEQIAANLTKAGLSGYDMEIRYRDGRCTLAGSVGSEEQVRAALSAAEGVPGVQSVGNELSVGGPTRTASAPTADARRRAMYRQALMGGPAPGVRPAAHAGGMSPIQPPCPAGGMPAGLAYNQPNLPDYAWPTYAQHPNYAAVTYPKDYSASAWPYIGPYYPYPQVPLGWREVELEWDDGQWYLDFNDRTDKWWWFLRPDNW